MKKSISLLAVLALVLTLAAQVMPAVFAADTAGSQTETDNGEKEYVRFYGDGFDPYASFEFSIAGNNDRIDPDTVQWAAIRHRTASRYNENDVEYIAQFYVYPPAEPFIPVHYVYTGEWETVIVDMTSVAALYGRESIWNSSGYSDTRNIRLDPLEPDRDAENFDDSTGRGIVTEGDYIDIAWIAFFETEDEARSYTGTEDTPYCLLDADSLSSPFSVHNLKTEYFSITTADPNVTEPPAGTDSNGLLFALNYEDDLNDMLFNGGKNIIEEVYFDDGCYVIVVPAGGDPNIELCFGTLMNNGEIDDISADEYKVIQFGLKADTGENGRTGNLYWQTDANPGYSEPQNYQLKYADTNDIQVVNADLSRTKKWTGLVGNLRFDPFPETSSESEVKLYYIAFFANVDAANAFGDKFLAEGLPATPVPTEKPTPAPTAVPTEAPATDAPTAVSEATAAPETSGADDSGGDSAGDNSSGKGLPTGAVIGIVAGVIVIAAAISGIMISRSKKK